jgi:hypothetical protein
MHGFSTSKKKAIEAADNIDSVTTALTNRPGIKLRRPVVPITIPVSACNIGM